MQEINALYIKNTASTRVQNRPFHDWHGFQDIEHDKT